MYTQLHLQQLLFKNQQNLPGEAVLAAVSLAQNCTYTGKSHGWRLSAESGNHSPNLGQIWGSVKANSHILRSLASRGPLFGCSSILGGRVHFDSQLGPFCARLTAEVGLTSTADVSRNMIQCQKELPIFPAGLMLSCIVKVVVQNTSRVLLLLRVLNNHLVFFFFFLILFIVYVYQSVGRDDDHLHSIPVMAHVTLFCDNTLTRS